MPKPGVEPRFPTLQPDSLPFEPPGKPKRDVSEIQFQIFMFSVNFCVITVMLADKIM